MLNNKPSDSDKDCVGVTSRQGAAFMIVKALQLLLSFFTMAATNDQYIQIHSLHEIPVCICTWESFSKVRFKPLHIGIRKLHSFSKHKSQFSCCKCCILQVTFKPTGQSLCDSGLSWPALLSSLAPHVVNVVVKAVQLLNHSIQQCFVVKAVELLSHAVC